MAMSRRDSGRIPAGIRRLSGRTDSVTPAGFRPESGAFPVPVPEDEVLGRKVSQPATHAGARAFRARWLAGWLFCD